MGLLGTSAQAFTDDFLKTYMAIGEDERAENAEKLAREQFTVWQQMQQAQKQQMEAQNREIQAQAAQREYALQQDASMQSDMMNLPVTINQRGLMNSGIIDPKTQSSDPVALKQVAMRQRPAGLLGGELAQPSFEDKLGVLGKYDPKAALGIQGSIEAQREKVQPYSNPYDINVGGKRVRVQKNLVTGQEKPVVEDKSTTVTNITGGMGKNPAAIALAKDRFKSLSKAESKAQDSIFKVEQYNKLISDLGKGNVGGFEGGVRAFLAPVAEALGLDPDAKMGEAQAFKLMSRALIGDMRLELVGSGPVSDAEQKLLSKLSGGDIASSRAAAKGLFEIYRNRSKSNIKNYHSQYDLLQKRYPEIKDNFMRFDDVVGEESPQQNTPARDISIGVSYLKSAANRSDAVARIKALSAKGWTRDELSQMVKSAGLE